MRKVFICIFFFFILENILGIKVNLKRKYPNLENGVYQLDNMGAPIKIVDVNYGHKWEIPKSKKGVNEYAVVHTNGKIKKFSEGTNLIYGTTKKIDVDKKFKETKKIKKNKDIKNVSNVTKIEKEEKKKKKILPKAMHIEAENVIEEKKENDINLGEEIGTTLKEDLEMHYENTQTPSHLTTELIDNKMPLSLEKLLMNELEETKWVSKKPVSDKVCLRDYSKQCPFGWEKISDKKCIAPRNYDGPCAHIMEFEPLTAKEKSELASNCNVHWLCINESCGNKERNYSRECPVNWTYTGKCHAPEDYTGGCDKIMDFDTYTTNEKKEFSSTCKVVWPCKEDSCERDYSITCPKGWSYNASKDLCKSPKEYEELIPHEEIEKLTYSSYYERMNFSTKYDIEWPCKKECKYGYDKYVCPKGWINLMDSGICKSPDDYVGPLNCPKITHFDYMTNEDKELFSKKCNVKWLCIENAEKDYSKCPLNFEYIEEGSDKGKCKPTINYKGYCKDIQDILSLTLQQKYNFEENCEADFPKLKKEDIQQTDLEDIPKYKIQKLLKGTHTVSKGVTLE